MLQWCSAVALVREQELSILSRTIFSSSILIQGDLVQVSHHTINLLIPYIYSTVLVPGTVVDRTYFGSWDPTGYALHYRDSTVLSQSLLSTR